LLGTFFVNEQILGSIQTIFLKKTGCILIVRDRQGIPIHRICG